MASEEDLEFPVRAPLGLLARGMLMGLAEVVPGVSGGTIAFVTGIYQDLVMSLARFGPGSISLVTKPFSFYQHHNLRFLLLLAMGMGFGVLAFANLMHFLLAHYQPMVWAFFSGVIAMSVLVIGRSQPRAKLVVWMPLGCVLGLLLLWLPPTATEASVLAVFAAGMVAVCAWLLPAVSGSFVLLSLGLYEPIIAAIAQFDWPILAAMAAGCVTGILLFARVLGWLMRHHGALLLSLLTGFMLGSLPKLWPWQDAAESGIQTLLGPSEYTMVTGDASLLVGCLLCAAMGAVGLYGLHRFSGPA